MKKTMLTHLLLFGLFNLAIAFNTKEQAKIDEKPLLFTENKGQIADWEGKPRPDILFETHSKGVKLFFNKNGISYQFLKTEYLDGYEANSKHGLGDEVRESKIKTTTHRFDMELVGANPNPTIIKEGKTDYVENYYLAHCQNGILNVATYTKVIYKDIYPKIDWVVYTNGNEMKYDFVVHPGGNPNIIKVAYKDASDIKIKDDGSLLVSTKLGEVVDQRPISFQGDTRIESSFNLEGNLVRYYVGSYDKSKRLVIDPGIEWATYYGGSSYDYGNDIKVSANGDVYIVGHSKSTTGISSSGFQVNNGGLEDAFLVKFNSSGSRLWATYYGGSGLEWGDGIAIDINGNLYIGGVTYSNGIASNGFQNTKAGTSDAFLVKFNSSGSRLWATYYGGNTSTSGQKVATDATGNVYLAGLTSSTTNIASSGHNNNFSGGIADVFLVKFNSSGSRLWATYYGGSDDDQGANVTVDGSDNVILTGVTNSTNNISNNGFQNVIGGSRDAFLVKFNSGGTRLWGTYFGSSSNEAAYDVITDINNNIYIVGETMSTNNIASNGFQNTNGGGKDAFLAKFNSNGGLIWATYYGGTGNELGSGVDVSTTGNIFISGETSTKAFAAKFDGNGNLIWGTYFGGGSEYGVTVGVDASTNVYLTGSTLSSNNISYNGFQNTYGGSNDAFLVKLIECGNSPTITLQPQSQTTCSNKTVTFTVTATGANLSYQWQYSIDGLTYQNCTSTSFYSGFNTNTLTVSNLSSLNNFWYRCTVTNYITCSINSNSVQLKVNPIKTKTQSIQICQGGNYTIGLNTYSIQGVYIDTLDTQFGCDSIVTTNLSYFPSNTPTIISDGTIATSDTINSGDILQLQLSGSIAPNSTILWTPNTSISSTNTTNTLVYPTVTTTYTATFTNTNGCTQSASIIVYVKPMPNVGNIRLNSTNTINFFDTLYLKVELTNVNGLYGLYMKVKGDNNVINYLTYAGYKADTLLGVGNAIISTPPTVTNGVYDFGITKVGALPGYTGSGTFYTLKFVTKSIIIPNNTTFCFYIDDISAYNASGIQVGLTNQGQYCLNFTDKVDVWPGDLNNSKTVTTADLLPIGYFYNSTGPARANATLQWVAQSAMLWGFDKSSINGSAYKVFADSNGDGIISNADQTAVGLNIGKFHAFKIPQSRPINSSRAADGSLQITCTTCAIQPNQPAQTLSFGIQLTNSNLSNTVYGISFEIPLDTSVFDFLSSSVSYNNSIFGTSQVDFLNLETFSDNGISIGMTRFNNAPINTNGLLCTLNLKTKPNLSAANTITLQALIEAANNKNGDELDIADGELAVSVGIKDLFGDGEASYFRLYPNPTGDKVLISLNDNEPSERCTLRLYTLTGIQLYSTEFTNKIELSTNSLALAKGVYFVEVVYNKANLTNKRKLIIF